MKRYGRLALSAGLIAFLCVPPGPGALAQAPAAGAAAETAPLYRIEVIVFAYNEGNFGEEDFKHIARRDVPRMPITAQDLELAVFDFAPYLPEESELPIDGSELELEGIEAEGVAAAEDAPGAELDELAETAAIEPLDELGEAAANEGLDAPPAQDDVVDATPPLMVGPPAEAAGPAAPAAEVEVDPFGGPGNVLAPFRFRLLAQDELALVGMRQRLTRLNAYTPLVHGGWVQEALPQQQAQPFDFAYLGVTNPAGTLRLHISRFLHLTLDLEYRELLAPQAGTRPPDAPGSAEPAPAAAPSGGFSPRPALSTRDLADVEVSRRYHLNSERRIRSTEVHYFDSPFFGVIVVVQPYEPAAPPAEGVGPAA